MLEHTFFLKGHTQTIVADGVLRRVDTPAADGADPAGRFQSAVRAALDAAAAAGVPHPIVVGAIPFDSAQASALYVPERWNAYDSPEDALAANVKTPPPTAPNVVSIEDNGSHSTYTASVERATAAIRGGELDKVVLARLRYIVPDRPVSSAQLLARLVAQNRGGHTFHVPLPGGSRLCGTSPELLVRTTEGRLFSQPLAGSAARRNTAPSDAQARQALLVSSKDRHEHKLVVDAVRATLAPRCVELVVPNAPECVATAKLWHLATSISGVPAAGETALTLACRLHPTPALSGFPHAAAKALLTELEPFDRRFFGGIVGWCDAEGNGEWYIAIRCGEVAEDRVALFAGAGVVGDSVPEAEWHETEVKLGTMMHAFSLESR